MSRLPDLLVGHRDVLVRFFEKHGRALRRYESAEDLAQGVHLHAIRFRDNFEYRDEPSFLAWLFRVARQHLVNRVAHWKALKRDAGPMMRLSFGASGLHPEAAAAGPMTHASRREQLRIAARAMDGLPPRDREIVQLMTAGSSIQEIAAHLGVSDAAAQRARLRAMDRFRKIHAIMRRR